VGNSDKNMTQTYDEGSIKTLDWQEHIRRRPGMYIGKLGDGSASDDGIYVLLKEVVDNSIDEFMMGNGKKIEIRVSNERVTVRDYGRGIPLGKLKDASSKMNTGAKYDSEVFKKSVGLNGVGIKAVNALSSYFQIKSFREGEVKELEFSEGNLQREMDVVPTNEPNGTYVCFTPDASVFKNYHFIDDYVVNMVKNYTFLNAGLTIEFNGERYYSRNGLRDLLEENMESEPLYPIIHLKNGDIEIAITHGNQYGEDYYSFVNGQHTTQGGTHLMAFREAIVKTIRDFTKKITTRAIFALRLWRLSA
jgi:topoisomerase-4 subunit B